MADQPLEKLLVEAQKAYQKRDKRLGARLIDEILQRDVNYAGAWDLLYRLSVQGRVKHLLNLPDYIYLYDLVLAGWSGMDRPVAAKLMRSLDEMVHHDRAEDQEFLSEGELRRQIVRLRAGNVARHVEGDEAGV